MKIEARYEFWTQILIYINAICDGNMSNGIVAYRYVLAVAM
jgi:hypothetical protein